MAGTKGSFSIFVIERILAVLYENGGICRTTLACKTGLNYSTCVRYVRLLEIMHWIEFSPDHTILSLTSEGFQSGMAFAQALHLAWADSITVDTAIDPRRKSKPGVLN